MEMVFGDCELAVGDAPDKASAIASAKSNGHKKAKKPDEPVVAAADPRRPTPRAQEQPHTRASRVSGWNLRPS